LKNLAAAGHSLHVLSRHAGTNLPPGVRLSVWDASRGEPPADSLQAVDAVIHLAGEPVAQRWNAHARQAIRQSRVTGTRNLVQALAKLPKKPEVLVCASAVGYYGSRGDEILNESSSPGADYLAQICVDWEQEAQAAEASGIRVVRVRTGLVLDARGGALARMPPPITWPRSASIGNRRRKPPKPPAFAWSVSAPAWSWTPAAAPCLASDRKSAWAWVESSVAANTGCPGFTWKISPPCSNSPWPIL